MPDNLETAPTQAPRQPSPLQIAKAMAVSAAMVEILKENQKDLVKRAADKLRAMGITVTEKEIVELTEPQAPA